MKKLIILCICSCLTFALSGCAAADLAKSYISLDAPEQEEAPTPGQRVYMDEIKGTLVDFTGSQLTLQSQELSYAFDVSQATLECAQGMITGDEISVIYEGQLSDTDTSTVKALKVVDDIHKTSQLKEHKTYGEVQSLTPNTITVKTQKGDIATYPITGTEQYYQGGIRAGSWVYIHYKGNPPQSGGSGNLKVLSISDVDPMAVPEPTPTPTPGQDAGANDTAGKQLHAVIQDISANVLSVVPSGSETALNVDLSQIPTYFKGGAAPGSYVNIAYMGELQEGTLDGVTVTAVTGDDPDTMADRNLSYTVSGTIIGSTANTVTIQTWDGACVTCFTEGARDTSTGGLAQGMGIRVTFDPAKSRQSNIYTSIKIEDA